MKQSDIFSTSEGDAWYKRNNFSFDTLTLESDLLTRLLKLYSITPRKVLEIGCSAGFRLNLIAQAFGSSCSGIDPSLTAIQEGKKKYPSLNLYSGTCDNIPLQEKFDLVIVHFVLHWVDREDLAKCISEIDRLIAPGGFLLLGDFYPEVPVKNKYHHLPEGQVWTYKQDYAKIFTSLNYIPIASLMMGHPEKSLFMEFICPNDPDKRSQLNLLWKR